MQRWPTRALPTNLNPTGTRCIQITIPDDDDWEREMYAEVSTLAQWMRWQRDLGHNGKPVADRWLAALKTWQHCDGSVSPVNGIMEDFEMPLRVDCDCNVFITCCDGTEKQILTSDQVRLLITSQPGAGSPQPQPGSCQKWSGGLHNGNVMLVPTSVSTGDIISIDHFNGATTDAAPIGRWNCPDGKQFVFGDCVDRLVLDPTAVAPSLPLGQLLFIIGATYYDAITPLTVPGGISNQQIAIVLNYPSGSSIVGDVALTVERCNNQAPTWSHTFDFTLSPGPWEPESDATNTDAAVWTAGVGWVQTDQHISGTSYQRIVGIQLDPIAFALDSLAFTYSRVMGHLDTTATSGQNLVYNTSVVDAQTWGSLLSGTNQAYAGPQPATITSRIAVLLGCANSNSGPNTDGSCVITKATITGHGSDPFI